MLGLWQCSWRLTDFFCQFRQAHPARGLRQVAQQVVPRLVFWEGSPALVPEAGHITAVIEGLLQCLNGEQVEPVCPGHADSYRDLAVLILVYMVHD
jgi:hypothetical protein